MYTMLASNLTYGFLRTGFYGGPERQRGGTRRSAGCDPASGKDLNPETRESRTTTHGYLRAWYSAAYLQLDVDVGELDSDPVPDTSGYVVSMRATARARCATEETPIFLR